MELEIEDVVEFVFDLVVIVFVVALFLIAVSWMLNTFTGFDLIGSHIRPFIQGVIK
jgi:hypothetical protein